MKYFIGVDIGGTKCAVSAVEKGKTAILSKTVFNTESSRGWKCVVDDIIKSIQNLMMKLDIWSCDVLAAGISCGGPLDSKKGIIMCPPNLPDWDGVPICEIIKSHFGFPVFLQNDANACAVAEWRYGAGKGCENMIFLTFGTGMGAGLILNGRLYSGTNDLAGETGHIRLAETGPEGYGKKGSFEGFCSGGGIERYAKQQAQSYLENGKKSALFANKTDIEKITAKTIAQAALNGDEFSVEIYKNCGRKLGEGLAVLVDILNPERIVIGSVYARSEKLLRSSMLETLKREALARSLSVCRIVPAALGEKIGDYAALGTAAEGYERMNKSDNNT